MTGEEDHILKKDGKVVPGSIWEWSGLCQSHSCSRGQLRFNKLMLEAKNHKPIVSWPLIIWTRLLSLRERLSHRLGLRSFEAY